MDVTIIIGTYGDDSWRIKANKAIESAIRQGVDFIQCHGKTLASARNSGAAAAKTEWLVFLDADDELADGYVAELYNGAGDLRAPAVQYVVNSVPQPPVVFFDRNIIDINPCVVGTMIRKEDFDYVGGFWEEPAYEDWSLFRRVAILGGRVVHHPQAVYIAHHNDSGRNSTVHNPTEVIDSIKQSHVNWVVDTVGFDD